MLDLGVPLTAVWGQVRVGAVDTVSAEARAARLMARSIKQSSKRAALELAIRCVDLTTLEGADTAERVRALCARARRPDPLDASVPPVAAVCVYPELVEVAKRSLAGSGMTGGGGVGGRSGTRASAAVVASGAVPR